MRSFKPPIWTLMLLVVPVAVGFGALRNPTALTAGCVLCLTVGLILFALVGTVARQGNGRLPYLGFTAFGTGYLGLAFMTGALAFHLQPTTPSLLTGELAIVPQPTLPTTGLLDSLSNAFPVGESPIKPNPLFSFKGFVSRGASFVTQERFWFDQTGHYLFALLIGLMGSILARYFATKPTGGGQEV